MDEDARFTNERSIKLTLPLAVNFEKTLFDFVQLVASKAGFDAWIASKISKSISRKVFSYMEANQSSKPNRQVTLSFLHRKKQVIVQIELPELNICEIEEY